MSFAATVRRWGFLALAIWTISGLWPGNVFGQGASIPPSYGTPSFPAAPAAGFPPSTASPSATMAPGIQAFDPYSMPATPPPATIPGMSGFGAPTLPPPPATTSWPAQGLTNPTAPYPAVPPTMFGAPAASPYGVPPTTTNPLAVPPVANPYGVAPATTYGITPYAPIPFAGMAQPVTPPPYQRLFQNTGFRYTWIVGDGEGDEMGQQDLELATTANCMNCFSRCGGMRVTPGFIFTWLDGPSGPVTAEMPAELYSAYLDFGFNPVITPQISGEIHLRPGVFSDFQSVTTDSIRVLGSGIGVIKLNPTSALKLGVVYVDRADIKMLPAFGVLLTPSPQSRWDIFFPSPKVSCYWRTFNNGQVWWYLGAEYGGGSWSIEREGEPEKGAAEQVDINENIVFAGLECYNLNRMYSFIEMGYVFERELFYVVVPSDRTSLADTMMLRAGVAF